VLTLAKRAGSGAAGAIGVFGLFCALYALTHMRAWEWRELYPIAGTRGVLFAAFLITGLVAFTGHCIRRAIASASAPRTRWFKAFMLAWVLAMAWLAEWCYVEDPPTVALRDRFIGPADEEPVVRDALARYRADGSLPSIRAVLPNADERRLATMLARVAINRPSVFARVPIGTIITENAARYGVSPVLLLDWTYIDSFYGKAPSGPVPFCAEMNVQLFRHLVQAHLPPWLIESRFRIALVEGPWLTHLAGTRLGNKLRYGAQKATYDIPISPYMNSVMSDMLLVLQEYPGEFPELFGPDAAPSPLAEAFLALHGQGLLKPYDQPYTHAARDPPYYDRYRDHLISFARAAIYRLGSDFSFATKAQALVARYYTKQYAERIGPERWAALSERQQTALLALLRDVYTPNIGHLSYNLYMLPELNATPIRFLADQIARDPAALTADRTWTPSEPEKLWGATGLMLRVLSEVWDVTTGAPLKGVHPTDTMDDSLKVLVRNR
jgi:hypothetical protein